MELSLRGNISKVAKELEGEITCAICRDIYQQAKLLPCNHYYCGACIEALAKRSGQPFDCPECRMPTTLPPGGVAKLDGAFFVERLIDLYGKFVEAKKEVNYVTCEQCEGSQHGKSQDGWSVAFCRTCVKYICEDCVGSHLREKGHKVDFLHQKGMPTGTLFPLMESFLIPKCPDHDELLEIFCFDCNHLICIGCVMTDHREHKTDFVKTYVSKYRMETLHDSLALLRKVQADMAARVVPTGVFVSPSVLSANVQWIFDDKVQTQIKGFNIEISSDRFHIQMHKKPPNDRIATISGLLSGTAHYVTVVAVYKDDFKATSEMVRFTTQVSDSPSNIEVTPQYPGSPSARVMWSFAGESSDLASFHVVIQADGERLTYQELASGSREAVVREMLPLKTHQITVIAVYRDGVEKKGSAEFTHSDRSCPLDINITPDYNGSPNATATWSFTGAANDLSHFRVAVEAEDKGTVLDDSVTKDKKGTRLQNLQSLTKHKVTVIAVYSDGIQKCNSVDFTHTDRCYPEEIEVSQNFPGSSTTRVNWSFPDDVSHELSDFILSVKAGDDKVICYKNTAAVNRSDTLANLKPGKRYTVAVAAHYKDGIKKMREVEHENMDRSSPDDIKIAQEIPGSTQAMVGWSFPENCNAALAQFFITIKKEENGRVVYEMPVASQERDVHIANLQPSTKYIVTVVAKYSDGILKESSKEYTNCDRCYPEEIEVTQNFPGSSMARVNWSFPEDVSPELSDFILSVKAEGDDKVICLKNTAAVNRSDTLTNLKPGKRYTVAVAAHYKDGIEKMREVEHEIVDQNGSKKPDTRSSEGNETLPYPVPEIQGDTKQFKVNPEPTSISSSKDAAQFPMPSPKDVPGEVAADHEKFHNTATEKQNGSKKPDTGEGSGTLPYPVPETQEADTQQIKEPTSKSSISPSKEAVQSPIPSAKDDYGEVTTAGHSKLHTPENIATDTCSGEGTGILVLPHPSTKTEGDQIRELVYQDTHKAGLCVICSCTNPCYAEPIENCTAPQKMRTCFESKLGYSTILVGPDMSTQDLYDVLRDLKIPEACSDDYRFLFYFFGRGTDDEICLADGNFKRSDIISELQKLSPNIFKIVFFDSCRTDSNSNTYSFEVTMHKPIQETASIQGLSWTSQWKKEKHYPYADCVNTLVINATDYNSMAYYIDGGKHADMKGCGLVTHYFTTLAPLMNESLPDVLAKVRVKVDGFIKEYASAHTGTILRAQVLVYDDRLMGKVNLLAESKGTERVRPEIILPVESSFLSTTVQWDFRLDRIDNQIQTFDVIYREETGASVTVEESRSMLKNVASFSNAHLKPKTTYCVKVVAVYKDGFKAESDEVCFITKDRPSQDISITPAFPGSSKAVVKWHFAEPEQPYFLSYSLPEVKKYSVFANALKLLLLQPIEVITLTSEGKVVVNDKEDISVCVPDGAVPDGRRMHVELGSAMHGNFSFPENMCPVSPILWICPQEEMTLQKPFKITLPHTVKYEEGTTELVFLKACHEDTSTIAEMECKPFRFEIMTLQEKIEFSERSGSVFTKQFCFLCIAQLKVPKHGGTNRYRYVLLRAQPRNWNASEFSVDYCVTYNLATCVRTFRLLCEKRKLEVEIIQREFTFNSDGKIELHYTDPLSPLGWTVKIRNQKKMIKEDDVYFWDYDADLLHEYLELRSYPPKITIKVYEDHAKKIHELGISFSGACPALQDSITLSPRKDYSSGWIPRSLYRGKDTREYNTLLDNFTSITNSLTTVTGSKDELHSKFLQKRWLDITASPSESELVILVLGRVAEESRTFYEFVMLLSEIGGMDLAAKALTTTLQEYGELP